MLIKYIPNILCLFRIFCILPFTYFLLCEQRIGVIYTIVLGGISDFFDGYIARKYNAETKIGKLLDPLADKIFANVILWELTLFHHVSFPYWCAYLILAIALSCRDFVLLLGSGFVLSRKILVPLQPLYISKICTTLVFIFIAYSIVFRGTNFHLPVLSFSGSSIQHILELFGLYLGYTSVLMVFATFIIYVIRFMKNISKDDPRSSSRL